MISNKDNNYECVPFYKIESLVDEINNHYSTYGKVDYSNLDKGKEIKGFEGYIGPNGEFYKTSLNYVHHPSHEDWAFNFIHDYYPLYKEDIKKHPYEITKYADASALLVHRYGFVGYTHSQYKNRKAGFVFPFDNYDNLTYNQKITMKLLLLLNEPEYYDDFMNNFNGHTYLNGEEIYRFDEFKKHKLKGYR